jgi:hypothetical protein
MARFSQFNFNTIMVLDRNGEEGMAYLAIVTVIIVFSRQSLKF